MPQNGEIANPAMLDNPDGDVWKVSSTTYPPTYWKCSLVLNGNPAANGGGGIMHTFSEEDIGGWYSKSRRCSYADH